MASHIDEFPSFEIPNELLNFLEENGWEDVSYHNEPCPSFEKNLHLLWVEYQDPNHREGFKRQFNITLDPYEKKDGVLFETDDVDLIMKKLKLLI